jgi:hypothetical protein
LGFNDKVKFAVVGHGAGKAFARLVGGAIIDARAKVLATVLSHEYRPKGNLVSVLVPLGFGSLKIYSQVFISCHW